MHGRVKVRTTAEQEALKKVERLKKLAQYRAGITVVFQKRKDKVWDIELLSITERILLQNPDIYTLWNIRREAFENNDWSKEDYAELLQKELTLTENCLRENPKSYTIWHQRCWVMERMPEPNWEKELSLCAKCLNIDERNFHCWDYRQFVVEKAGVPDAQEFDFSTQKILSNFSNYSSWHYRSKILSKMFHDDEQRSLNVEGKHNEELNLVMDAAFTDPNDSSAWFYQRWLLDDKHPLPTIWQVRLRNDTIIVVFDKDTIVEPDAIQLFTDGTKIDVEWKSYETIKSGKVWFARFANLLKDLTAYKQICVTFQEKTFFLLYSNLGREWIYKRNLKHNESNYNKERLGEQLKNYRALAKMEPNNKWAILIGVFLMTKIDFMSHCETILKDLISLSQLDSLRANYYKDLRSAYILDHALYKAWAQEDDFETQSGIDLSSLGLTTLHNNQYLTFFREVNLRSNQLHNSLHRLSTLQNCTYLNLSNNQLTSIRCFPTLQNLRNLSLMNNKLESLEEILEVIKRHKLTELNLQENPVCQMNDIVSKIKDSAPNLTLFI